MKSTYNYPELVKTLKSMLKNKKISYQALAAKLHITESGVKKIFSAKDCSLQRLDQICQIVGISLADLLQEQGSPDVADISYTEEQQDYFLKDRVALNFFWRLAFERQSVEQIQLEQKMNSREVFKYLKKLDELKLIRLEANNKVRVPKVRRIRSFGKGPLIEKLYRDWSVQFMNEIAKPQVPSNEHFSLRYIRMKKETYSEFITAIKELESEFLKRAVREMSLYDNNLTSVRWVTAIDQKSFAQYI